MARLITSNFDDDSQALTLTVGDAGTITIDISNLQPDIRHRAMVHGLVQKISDAAALGKDASANDKFAAMQAIADRLVAGEWKQARGETTGNVAGVIFRAFAEYVRDQAKRKKAAIPADDAIRAIYDRMERKQQLALRTVPEIATIIARIKSEQNATKTPSVDVNALFDELGF